MRDICGIVLFCEWVWVSAWVVFTAIIGLRQKNLGDWHLDVFRLLLRRWWSHQYTFKAQSCLPPQCWLQPHQWIRNSSLVCHHSVLPVLFFFSAMQIETACVYLSSFHCLCCDTQGSDCTHWFTLCIQTWLVKSLGCCWRSTTQSCCICWSRQSPCTLRYINVHVFLWAGLHCRLYIKMDDKPQLPSPVQQWNQNSSKIGGAGLF